MPERPSPRAHEPTPDRLPLRERVSPEVLSYLGHLRGEMREIAKKQGVTDLRRLPAKIESEDVPMDDVDRLVELKDAFERTVARTGSSKEEPWKTETEAERRLKKLLESLGGVADRLLADESPLTDQIRDAVDKLPLLPAEDILSSPFIMSDVLRALRACGVKPKSRNLGVAASLVMNHLIQNMPEGVRGRVVQAIDGGGVNFLGYEWCAGTLLVAGTAGEYLGAYMKDGRIEAEDANSILGGFMSGGTINISGERAIPHVGFKMKNGIIRLKNAGDNLGQSLDGGSIFVRNAYGTVGTDMRSGSIEISDEVRGDVGKSISGGRIWAHTVIGNVSIGEEMGGNAIIHVDRADHARVGIWMQSGQIEINGPCDQVGLRMIGGTVLVNGGCKEVGEQMSGGDISITSNFEDVSRFHPRLGGTVVYNDEYIKNV